jgi:hypothetical protein
MIPFKDDSVIDQMTYFVSILEDLLEYRKNNLTNIGDDH